MENNCFALLKQNDAFNDDERRSIEMSRQTTLMTYFIISGFSMSSSSNCNQQSMEMRNRGAINKTAGTLMSFGPVHDKYTKGIDISQVFCHEYK